MCILTRHVLGQFLKVQILALIALTMAFLLGGLVHEAVKQSLPPVAVLRLIPYLLPQVLLIVVPVTLLLAATTVFGRMAGANEMLALKAAGISPIAVLAPVWGLAFLISLLTVWINDVANSWGRLGVQRVVIESLEEIIYGVLRTQKGYTCQGFSLHVKQVDGRRLSMVMLSVKDRDSGPAITVTAQQAEIHGDPEHNALKVMLYCGSIDVAGQVSYRFSDLYQRDIPLDQATQGASESRHPSVLALREIPAETERISEEIENLEKRRTAEAAFAMLTGNFHELARPKWRIWEAVQKEQRIRLRRLHTEPNRRWSAGFSCLCFVWVGVPMAIWFRNRDFLTSFFLCFLPILIVYYPALMMTIDLAKSGTLPAASVWAGNLLMIAWGAAMLRKVMRY
jgi:lipopolysaccharide export system permease protein